MSNNGNALKVTASCGTGKVAVGGGGNSGSYNVIASYPSNAAGTPITSGAATSWTVAFSNNTGSNTAFVICAS